MSVRTQVGSASLHRFDLPAPGKDITVSQLWHPHLHADTGHRWLRALVLAECREP
ncbi:hypothetical protein [Pseudoxanthomonas sp.]|uniref:hypothetical protein n=1 Tax=Pseudoxanthomonas sp. TaxID=1871049 RepID=UPI0026265EEF|nr:hypothetical protein [Pseudoxanthomonas sp.]WDS35283.1 MAG: hypothetical protein O8I58_13090 [Pseudoxanthomonas sp.]